MKALKIVLVILLVASFFVFAAGSGESGTSDQGNGSVSADNKNQNSDQGKDTVAPTEQNDKIGKYSVVIDSCRLAKDYDGADVIIVKYKFTNVSNDDPTAFYVAFEDAAYQNGIELNEAYFLDDSANYDSENQTKAIKKGATLDVEVAYKLNDATTDVEIEVEEFLSFNDAKLVKKFSIAG